MGEKKVMTRVFTVAALVALAALPLLMLSKRREPVQIVSNYPDNIFSEELSAD